MADISMTGRDIDISTLGDIEIAEGDDEILQFAVNAITTIYGEMVFHPTIGNPVYKRRLKITESGGDTVMQDCITTIKADDRVADVTYMEVYYEEEDKSQVYIKFTLVTTSGHTISSVANIRL